MSGKDFVSKGQKIVLTCNITGGDHYTPDGVDWFINGHKVDHRTMPRMRIYNKVDNQLKTFYSTLEIRRSLMDDKGMYVCRGPYSKTSSISLHVLDGKYFISFVMYFSLYLCVSNEKKIIVTSMDINIRHLSLHISYNQCFDG